MNNGYPDARIHRVMPHNGQTNTMETSNHLIDINISGNDGSTSFVL